MDRQKSAYPTGRVVTFYSYKGGVGRSMSMANVGVILAEWGYKVLMIDWDLEAPGLENYFSNYIKDLKSVRLQKGLIDLLNMRMDNTSSGQLAWTEFIQPLTIGGHQNLHLLTAGKRDDNYVNNVRKFDYSNFYNNYDGGQYLEDLRDYWIREYDFVLIDSRTGLTDSSGICSIMMPDILLLLFTPNEQSFNGIKEVYGKAVAARSKIIYERFNLHAIPVPSRMENAETALQDEWIGRIARESVDILTWLPVKDKQLLVDPLQFIEKIKIPYRTLYAYGERLPAKERGVNDPQDIGYVYETIAAIVANDLQYVEVLMQARDAYVKVAKGEMQISLPGNITSETGRVYEVTEKSTDDSQVNYKGYVNIKTRPAPTEPVKQSSSRWKYLAGGVAGLLLVMVSFFFFMPEKKLIVEGAAPIEDNNAETVYNKFIADYTSSDSTYDLNFNLSSLQRYYELDTALQNRPQIQSIRSTIEQNIAYYFKDQIKKFYADLRNQKVNALTYFDDNISAYGDFRNLSLQALSNKFDSLSFVKKITNQPGVDSAVFYSNKDGFVLSLSTRGNFYLDRWNIYPESKDSLSFIFSKNQRINSIIYLKRGSTDAISAVDFPIKYRIDLFICKEFNPKLTYSIGNDLRGLNKYQVVNRGYTVPSDTANPYYIKSNEIRYNGNDELAVAKDLQKILSKYGTACKLTYARTKTPGIVSVLICY